MSRMWSLTRAIALLTLTTTASLLVADRAPAQDDEPPAWNSNGRHVVFSPHLASDAGDPPPFCPSEPDLWVTAEGTFYRIDGKQTFIPHDEYETFLFQARNPCDEPIVPPPLDATFVVDGVEHHVLMTGIPSIILPGGLMFYVPTLPVDGPVDSVSLTDIGTEILWEELIGTAKLLTVDRNGNSADMPEFDPTQIVQFGRTDVVFEQQGQPPVWPMRYWVYGSCTDGSLGLGQFNPAAFGLNPNGGTTVPGHLSFAGCVPPAISILGPAIEPFYVQDTLGLPRDILVFDDLTLEQTSPTAFRLIGTVANTNTVAGNPGLFNFELTRLDDGPPLAFSLPVNESVAPGYSFAFSINNIPGQADNYESIAGSITGTTPDPDWISPGWTTPPTLVRDPGEEAVLFYTALNNPALSDAFGPLTGEFRMSIFLPDPVDDGLLGLDNFIREADAGNGWVDWPLSSREELYRQAQEILAETGYIPVATFYAPD